MLVRRWRILTLNVNLRRYSQIPSASDKTHGQSDSKEAPEDKSKSPGSNEENNFDDEYVRQKNIYWLWTKRILFLGSLYTLSTTIYIVAKQAYFMEARYGMLEYEPFYSWGKKIYSGTKMAYEFLFTPPVTQLLPPKLPIRSEANKKTLVLNFEGTLYAKDFKAQDGIVIHLRPGFKKFMQKIIQNYEILLYSEEDTNFMGEVVQTIDPAGRFFPWYAGHEFMTWTSKGYRKDLKLVNRDIRRIVVVDIKKEIYANNPQNVLVLDKYSGEEEDKALKDLGLFLNYLANPSIKDIRPEIEKYGGENAVKNYAEKIANKISEQTSRRNFFSSHKRQIQ